MTADEDYTEPWPAHFAGFMELPDDEHGQFWLAPRLRLLVHGAEDGAKRPHLRPREMIAEPLKQLRISERRAGTGRGDEVRPDLRGIREPCHQPPARAGSNGLRRISREVLSAAWRWITALL